MFVLGASYQGGLFSCCRARGAVSFKDMQTSMFEETRPADYLTRAALSDVGKTYKGIVAGEMVIHPGDVVLDPGCGAGWTSHIRGGDGHERKGTRNRPRP
jgi:hypothetical protein